MLIRSKPGVGAQGRKSRFRPGKIISLPAGPGMILRWVCAAPFIVVATMSPTLVVIVVNIEIERTTNERTAVDPLLTRPIARDVALSERDIIHEIPGSRARRAGFHGSTW